MSRGRQIDIDRSPDGYVIIKAEGEARTIWPTGGRLLGPVVAVCFVLLFIGPNVLAFKLAATITLVLAVIAAITVVVLGSAMAYITGRLLVIEVQPDHVEIYVHSRKKKRTLTTWRREEIEEPSCRSSALWLRMRSGRTHRLLEVDSPGEARYLRMAVVAGLQMCDQCGYDIRASNGHCPECGKLIPEWISEYARRSTELR